jgi:hypothetical protein
MMAQSDHPTRAPWQLAHVRKRGVLGSSRVRRSSGLREALFLQAEQDDDDRDSVKAQHALFSAPAETLGGLLWVRGGCGLWLLAVG